MSKFFKDTMQGLLEAVQIKNGKLQATGGCNMNYTNNTGDKVKHKYRILYYETYVDTYEIEATSEEEAKEILLKKIDSSEIDPPNTLVSSDYDVEEI